jgi:hypothetical protein
MHLRSGDLRDPGDTDKDVLKKAVDWFGAHMFR